MVSNAISVKADANISDVAEILFSNKFHGLPVVENEKVVGIITEDDFFLKNYDSLFLPSYIKFIRENKVSGNIPEDIKNKIEKLIGAKATDVMTADCLTVSPEMEASELMEVIKRTKFTTFPVVDQDGKLAGIVTLSDILGTVKKSSKILKKALGAKNRELDKLAENLMTTWNDRLILISKKQVRTWKGITLIALIAFVGLASLLIVNSNSKNGCEIETKNVYPLLCQKFTYSEWGACQLDGIQKRNIIEKLPKNCEGGTPAEIVRPCQ